VCSSDLMTRSVLRQIADLHGLPMPELQARWKELIGTDPPRYNRGFLVRRLAHRIQELTYGGLSDAARAKMDELLDTAGGDTVGSPRDDHRRKQGRRELPIAGTRLIREWNGERHEVTVEQAGFDYRGMRYRSLSSIARAITGTRWNGPSFFGLRTGGKKEAAR
jgi:hypothetical protein